MLAHILLFLRSVAAIALMMSAIVPVNAQTQACARPYVSITTPELRRCSTAIYYIECSNRGTAIAPDAAVTLRLDDDLSVAGSSENYTEQDGAYVFALGDLAPGALRRFTVETILDCDAHLGQFHCVEARISPVDPCATPASPLWTGARLTADVECIDGQLQFTLANEGTADMPEPRTYLLFQDMVLIEEGVVQLEAGAQWTFTRANRGANMRLEAQQVTYYPGLDRPIAELEGCGTDALGFSSAGFMRERRLDEDEPWVDYACVENFDIPRDSIFTQIWPRMRVVVGDAFELAVSLGNHQTQAIQQATVHVTPQANVEPGSLELLGASHPYTIDPDGLGGFTVTFDSLNLPPLASDPLNGRLYLTVRVRAGSDLSSGVKLGFLYIADNADPVPIFLTPMLLELTSFIDTKQWSTLDTSSIRLTGRTYAALYDHSTVSADAIYIARRKSFINPTLHAHTWIAKTDLAGHRLWEKGFDFGQGEPATIRATAPDGAGGLIVAGHTYNATGAVRSFAARVDLDGNLVWYKNLHASNPIAGVSNIVVAPDGAFVIYGTRRVLSSTADRGALIKIDLHGNILWSRSYMTTEPTSNCRWHVKTPEGGYAFVEYSASPAKIYFYKTDSIGQLESTVTHSLSSGFDVSKGRLLALPDSGYLLLTNNVFPNTADTSYPVLFRFDAAGALLWQRNVVADVAVLDPLSIRVLETGGFLMAGYAEPPVNVPGGPLRLADMLAVNDTGAVLWHNIYELDVMQSIFSALHALPNGKMVAIGTAIRKIFGDSDPDLLLAFFDSTGYTLPTRQPLAAPDRPWLQAMPNPAPGYFRIASPVSVAGHAEVHWRLFDQAGRVVLTGQASGFPFDVQAPHLPTGVYWLEARWSGLRSGVRVMMQ